MSKTDDPETGSFFARINQSLQRRRRAKAMSRARDARVAATTERLIDEIDPRLRSLTGYRQKLSAPVRKTLAYTTDIVNMIPGPVQVSSGTWSDDPLIRALFSGPEDLRRLFSQNEEIRHYFDHRAILEPDHCYAMLSMSYQERTVLGTEMVGDMLKRDIKQIAVSFEKMRVVEPGLSEYELRADLQERAFVVLTAYALERITDLKLSGAKPQEQHQLAETQLKLNKVRNASLGSLLEGKPQQITELHDQLLHSGEELQQAKARVTNLDDYIDVISDVLNEPERHLRARQFSVRLNKMNIKVDDHPEEKGELLQLTELSLGDKTRRVMLLVNFPRKDLLARTDPLQEAMRILQ
jgi:hypothetical protein